MGKPESQPMVILKDSTLREGLDTPGVDFSREQKIHLLALLAGAGVPEAEVVAPSRVLSDMAVLGEVKQREMPLKTSGLLYSYSPKWREEMASANEYLDRWDILMPLSPHRRPYDRAAKIDVLLDVLDQALSGGSEVGVGFPHATQADGEFLATIARKASQGGAKRITLYDTNGSAEPLGVYHFIKELKKDLRAPLFFHAHNDLGLATANSLAAVMAGADGLDVTVNGLGDRAGNASLEQVALNLHLKGYATGINLKALPGLSRAVAEASGVPRSRLAPVVGEYVFQHKSPSHLEHPEIFEAFDPGLVGATRILAET